MFFRGLGEGTVSWSKIGDVGPLIVGPILPLVIVDEVVVQLFVDFVILRIEVEEGFSRVPLMTRVRHVVLEGLRIVLSL